MAAVKKVKRKLSAKEKKFCQEYSVDQNGTQAAIRAGYSAKTANEQAARMLAKVNIKAELKRIADKDCKRNEIKKDEIIALLKNWVYADITETFELTVTQLKKLPIHVRRLITSYKKKEVKVGRKTTFDIVEIKFVSKEKAVEILNQMLGFNAPTKVQGEIINRNILNIDPLNETNDSTS